MQSVTVPYPLMITLAVLLAVLALTTVAWAVQHTSARRSIDLSRPSPHTRRTNCPRPGCTIVHPSVGRHRADPHPDGPFTTIAATLALAVVLRPQRGQHY